MIRCDVVKRNVAVQVDRIPGEARSRDTRDKERYGEDFLLSQLHSKAYCLAVLAIILSPLGCTRSRRAEETGASIEQWSVQVTTEFKKINSFVKGDACIAVGQTKDEIREQLSLGRVILHKKPYAFRKPEPDARRRAGHIS